MENKQKRYELSGFVFGTQNYFNLTFRIKNHANHGTSYLGEFDFELSEEERMELIKLLINAGDNE